MDDIFEMEKGKKYTFFMCDGREIDGEILALDVHAILLKHYESDDAHKYYHVFVIKDKVCAYMEDTPIEATIETVCESCAGNGYLYIMNKDDTEPIGQEMCDICRGEGKVRSTKPANHLNESADTSEQKELK